MRHGIALCSLLTALLLAAAASAQEPAPAPAPAPTQNQATDGVSASVLTFFTQLATIAQDNKSKCDAMGNLLNAHLDQHQHTLRSAALSSTNATAEEEVAIMAAATQLGEAAGHCFENQEVIRFLDRFTRLAADLDQ